MKSNRNISENLTPCNCHASDVTGSGCPVKIKHDAGIDDSGISPGRRAFTEWLDSELEQLLLRFSADITANSLINSLRRDR